MLKNLPAFIFILHIVKRIGIFTSGGDSPGMNACIRAAVRTCLAYGIEPYGIRRGYEGMIEDDIHPLNAGSVSNIIQYGGTVLKTARSAEFRTPEGRAKAAANLKKNGIEGLICIGGNGSYTGAMYLQKEHGIPSIGCPGTIDNDLAGTDYTIGFDTAVNTAMDAIDRIRDTAESHGRVFFVEVMGRDSGYIGLYAGLAGGAEGILIPEKGNQFDVLIKQYEQKSRKKEFSIYVVAEGDEEGKALELSSRFLQHYPESDTRVVVLGHIQRGGKPSASDRILASRLGAHAVKGLTEGLSNCAVGVIKDEIVYTSFEEAIKGKKELNNNLWILNEMICR